MLRDKLVMKNFMITPGSSTSQMEQRSSDHIVPDVNDDNIDNGQCHHFSISAYVREMQMNDSNFHSLFYDHINSLLVTTKTFRRWYCESCRDKLEPLYNNTRTPARMLNGVARGLKHDVRKELSQEKGSEECRSPSYNIESMKVDRAVNDSYESTPINQKNGTAKCHSPSWVNKESSDAIPVLNDKDEAPATNIDGTTNIPSNVNFLDDTNPPDICEKIAEKKEMTNKVKLGFLHGESMLERRNTDNSMKTLPVKRHSIEKKVFKIYKRRKNTKVDCQDTSGMDSTFAHALPSSSSYKSEKAAQIRIEPRNQSALNMIQGRHLHGLIDLWKHTCFTQCEASTGNMPSRCLLPNSYHLHDQYDVENFISYRENNIINESCAPTMDISAKYQHPHCPSKPFRPVPRIGVLSPMLQKEVTTYSESCGTQSGYRLGMSEEEMPCQTYRGGNSASSSQKFRASYNPQHLGYVTSVAIPELLSERENSHSTKGKSKMVYSSDKSPEQDICAVSVSH